MQFRKGYNLKTALPRLSLGSGSTKKFVLCVFFLLPVAGFAQDVKNETGMCYRTIAGHLTYQSPTESTAVLIRCFDEVLAQCAMKEAFTECLEASIASITRALEVGKNRFDQSTLQSALPGRTAAWENFVTSLQKLQQMDALNTDAHVAKLRASFITSMKLDELR